jgi:hypothetical protein
MALFQKMLEFSMIMFLSSTKDWRTATSTFCRSWKLIRALRSSWIRINHTSIGLRTQLLIYHYIYRGKYHLHMHQLFD